MNLSTHLKIYKQKLIELKEEICKSTHIVGNFNRPLSRTNRIRRQKLNEDIKDLKCMINHPDLINIYRTAH